MINTWNESLLHEEIKDLYCAEGARKEVPIEGSICDVVLDDGEIVEIQTAHLGKLRGKLEKLLQNRRVTLVYPIARNTLIETYNPDGSLKSRRKSPKHGSNYQLFDEITGLWDLIGHPNLVLHVIHADILEIRVADGTGSWRRKGIRKDDKKLVKIHETMPFSTKSQFSTLIPNSLSGEFTVADLRDAGVGHTAGKMAWVLRKMGIIEQIGKKGNAFVYRKIDITPSRES
jgi:hypothetical protein